MKLKVLEFETPNSKYLFDGVTGSVFAVDDIIMDCLRLVERGINTEEVYKRLHQFTTL